MKLQSTPTEIFARNLSEAVLDVDGKGEVDSVLPFFFLFIF